MTADFVKDIYVNKKIKRTKEDLKLAEDKRQEAYDADSKMVTGVFHNLESPKGDLTFSFRMYKEEPHRTYYFEDGKEYTIPLGVAKHINNMTQIPQRDYAKLPDGSKALYTVVSGKTRRFEFTPTTFM